MLLIHDAVLKGLDSIDNAEWREHQTRAADCGIFRWLTWRKNHNQEPLDIWRQLKPGHVMEYTQWLRDARHLKESTVSLYLNPLRLAARWVQLYKPELYTQLFVRRVLRKSGRSGPVKYLMPDQIEKAILMARCMGYPEVVAAFHFGAYAGLRIKEFQSLTPDSLHGDGLWTGTKNEYSERLIPILPKVRSFAESYFSLFEECPVKSHFTISRRVRAVLDECARTCRDESFKMVDPHEALRTSFMNLANNAGCEYEAIRAYCGQAPDTTMMRHYIDLIPSINDMPRIRTSKLEVLTTRVLSPVDKKLSQ